VVTGYLVVYFSSKIFSELYVVGLGLKQNTIFL